MKRKAAIGVDHLMEYLEKRIALHGLDLDFNNKDRPTQPTLPESPSQKEVPTTAILPLSPSQKEVPTTAILPLSPSQKEAPITATTITTTTPPPASALPPPPELAGPNKPRPKSNEIPQVAPTARPYIAAQGKTGSAPALLLRERSISANYTKESAINTIINDSRPKLIKLQRDIAASRTVTDLMPLAKSVRELKLAVNFAKDMVPEVTPPTITQLPDEDKLLTFKKTTAGALEYVALTMRALKDGLESTNDEVQILNLAKAASKINSAIPSV